MHRTAWKHALAPLRWRKRLLARFVLSSLGAAGTSLLGILLVREFLGGVLGEESGLPAAVSDAVPKEAAIWIVAGLLLFTYVLASILSYDNQVTQQRIVKAMELGIMERLIWHLLSLSISFFEKQSHGDLVAALRQDVSQLRQVVLSAANITLELLVAVGLIIAAVAVSPWLALWGLVVIPAVLLPILFIARKTLKQSYAVRQSGFLLSDMILQILRGIRVIKAFRGEKTETRFCTEQGGLYLDSILGQVRTQALARVLLESTAGLGIVVVLVVGGFSVMRDELTWASLLAFIMALRALHAPLNNLNLHYVRMQTYGASVSRIAELLETEPEVAEKPDARPLTRAPERIAFEGVGFGYGDQAVLTDVSFRVTTGSSVGIAGPSGSGKTTLLNLIARFYDPTAGRITFDGVDLRDLKCGDVFDQIAIVTQQPFLFTTSVRENIRCGRPQASDEEVCAAARAAFIHEEIESLPDGYDTQVGLGGRGLSGGQSQRINVARALLKNAPILLLDEATSSLDSVAEEQVQQAIEKLLEGRTSFIVAHRLSTLRNADRILVLEKGVLVGDGPHQHLLENCALYRQLWETQKLEAPAAG